MKILLFLIMVLPIRVLAYSQDKATRIDQSCRSDASDPFDKGWRISTGSSEFANLCVNSKDHRPIEIVESNSAQIKFANFYHEGQFWIATWQKEATAKVKFQLVYFNIDIPLIGEFVHMAHAELVFHFESPLLLTSQTDGRTISIKDVVVDWEASPPMGFGFDPLKGFIRNEPILGRVVSLESRTYENLVAPNKLRKTLDYPLSMSNDQVSRLFENSLRASNKTEATEFYNTLSNNCVTKLFQIVDETLASFNRNSPARAKPFAVAYTVDPVAGPSINALVDRRLIERGRVPANLAKDLGLDQE